MSFVMMYHGRIAGIFDSLEEVSVQIQDVMDTKHKEAMYRHKMYIVEQELRSNFPQPLHKFGTFKIDPPQTTYRVEQVKMAFSSKEIPCHMFISVINRHFYDVRENERVHSMDEHFLVYEVA